MHASISATSIAVAALFLCSAALAAPKTELVKDGAGWKLLRDGKPYIIKGVGGSGSKQLLKDLGGNSFRTWDAEKIDDQLAEAQKLGLTVTVGIWLKHERHGFDYNDVEFTAKQLERVRQLVTRYKDHPAVLMWAIGNEMESKDGDDAAIWSHIESCAAMVKRIDPTRPVMTVTAEIGGARVKAIHELCPSIDVYGVNSYAGASSLVQRYRAAGGTKPIVITEFGPFGTWETDRDKNGQLPEPTANAKAEQYRKHYQATVIDGKDLVLGSYAFTWGQKLEMTQTWFGMMLKDGSKLPAVDVMSEMWTGKPPANRCPEIKPITLSTSHKVPPKQIIEAVAIATDPDGDALKYEWDLEGEVAQPGIGGDPEIAGKHYPNAIVASEGGKAKITMPAEPGKYRLYVYVRDGKGSATTANVPLTVATDVSAADAVAPAPVAATTARKAKLPFTIFADAIGETFAPTGWMGNAAAIKMDPACKDQPHEGSACLAIDYTAADDFGGVVWQDPPNDWGDKPGGLDFTGAKKITFWARGQNGGETIEFKFGVLGAEKANPDSSAGGVIVDLTPDWKQYEIDLAGKDLSRIKTPFCWVTAGSGKAVRFYLDGVRWE